MTTGIHHLTAITRNVQANVDFYAGFLGLHLVKRTGGFEDALQLHLFYGDATGAPGSLVTFLDWEDGAPGRVGHGQVLEMSFAIATDSIGDWLGRALNAHVPVEGPERAFGAPVLRLRDPDGIIVKLTGVPGATATPTRLSGATLLSADPEATAAFAIRLGYRRGPEAEGAIRLISDSDTLDIRNGRGFVEGIAGTGTFDHIALRAPGDAALRALRDELTGTQPVMVHDRTYFRSLYARDPAGVLFEYATDGPGFAVDEAPESLGQTLFVPGDSFVPAEEIRLMLPRFALPGEPRRPRRDLPFVHRFLDPEETDDGQVLLTLHGSGGSEADLFPLGRQIAPGATLLGLRGRATEEGNLRWYRRTLTGGLPTGFDQDDIRSEARAFAAFLADAPRAYGLDPGKITLLGHSNGASFAAATLLLDPQAVRRAILLRPIDVLDTPPEADLSGTEVLIVSGTQDVWRDRTARLADQLGTRGASVTHRAIAAGHTPVPEDARIARDWLATLG
ncbi:VOC family protein [Paenirhodobacter enshiensis]|uniref:Glyoxalase n=1 Tax=Paenirhodobacter enshiensis TaxID=1105367 RepID=A0A086Y773_9RHOB|nr:VOC family protein [Paenirhodobacter enshiensis]KFI30123.1 glyoxalase [Paenirhodobacter enshiensis]